jgi:hypothetical protein
MSTGFICLRQGLLLDFCEHVNKPSGLIKAENENILTADQLLQEKYTSIKSGKIWALGDKGKRRIQVTEKIKW